MLASLTCLIALGAAQAKPAATKVELHDPATFRADFNAAKGVPRVVIILSPS